MIENLTSQDALFFLIQELEKSLDIIHSILSFRFSHMLDNKRVDC